jgi:hypothetical protein
MSSSSSTSNKPPNGDDHSEFRIVADSTYDWESWVAPDGRLRWVNPAVTRLAGYTVAECFAMSDYPLSLIDDDDREWMAELLVGARAGSSGNDLEFRVKRKDGARRWAAMSWQPIVVSGEAAGYRASVRDVHERKRLEERLRQARREAADAEKVKSAFLANLSHELRSPLQCVLGGIELVRDGDLDERGRGWAEIIEDQAGIMLRQVEDLLQFVSHDTAPALRPRPLDLHRLCERAVAAITLRVAARGIATRCEIASDVPRWVTADADRLSQIVGNLLSNAAKFTTLGSISLSLSLARAPGGRVVMAIRDTGCGIPPDVVDLVKQPFFQAITGAPNQGLGLGLAVVERIAQQMNGRVTIESVVDLGTTVTVRLPLPAAGVPDDTPSMPLQNILESRPLRVLVVDDSDPARELAVATITGLGCVAVDTATVEGARALVMGESFDLVLMDYRLFGVDGITAARDIRHDLAAVGRTVTIVLLTADAFVEARVEEEDSPVDLIVRKPLRRDQLRDVLRNAATGFRASRVPKRPEPRKCPVLDIEVVRELQASRDASGRTLFERLGRKVIAHVGTVLAQLEASRNDLTASAVAVLAHRAKGDCLTVGARVAARAAGTLEDAALGGEKRAASRALDELMTAWADARVTMEGEFDAEPSSRWSY